jgi:hypothetical protein
LPTSCGCWISTAMPHTFWIPVEGRGWSRNDRCGAGQRRRAGRGRRRAGRGRGWAPSASRTEGGGGLLRRLLLEVGHLAAPMEVGCFRRWFPRSADDDEGGPVTSRCCGEALCQRRRISGVGGAGGLGGAGGVSCRDGSPGAVPERWRVGRWR